jgi:hypothetical protein
MESTAKAQGKGMKGNSKMINALVLARYFILMADIISERLIAIKKMGKDVSISVPM